MIREEILVIIQSQRKKIKPVVLEFSTNLLRNDGSEFKAYLSFDNKLLLLLN